MFAEARDARRRSAIDEALPMRRVGLRTRRPAASPTGRTLSAPTRPVTGHSTEGMKDSDVIELCGVPKA